MDKRLGTILSMIPEGRGAVDVGTDHAYLPVELFRRGYSGRIIATDINAGPLEAGRRNAERHGADAIEFRIGNGLDCCGPDEIDTVIIAGMGGENICDILDRAEWTMSGRYHIILQPMTKAEILRFWLSNNGYSILQENCVEDGGHIYSVLNVRYTGINEKYTDGELFCGKDPDSAYVEELLKSRFSHKLPPFYDNIKKELINRYDNK